MLRSRTPDGSKSPEERARESGSAAFHRVLTNRTDGASALWSQFVQLAQGQSRDGIMAGLEACHETFPLMAQWSYVQAQLKQAGWRLERIAARMARQTETTIDRAQAALDEFPAVMTLSNSSLVRRAILQTDRKKRVLCAVSQPGGEGRLLADDLRRAGQLVSVIDDDRLPELLDFVQAVVLGADQYDENAFINKVGSLNLAQQARRRRKPVLVLAEAFKRVPHLPQLTSESTALDLKGEDGEVGRQTVFERVPWGAHVTLISS